MIKKNLGVGNCFFYMFILDYYYQYDQYEAEEYDIYHSNDTHSWSLYANDHS